MQLFFRIGLLIWFSWSFQAQAAFPEKPIRIVVPFAPGGGTDLIARTLSVGLAKELGQSVLVENKPGAGTIIGSEAVAKAAPDGYTLLMATFAHALNPSLIAKLPYQTDKDFAPIVLIGASPNVLVVRSASPLQSVKDVIVMAKTSGKLTFASQGVGTSAHLAGELFNNLAKVNMTHVAYRGAGPAMTDLLGGQVDVMFATAAAAGALLDSGKLRALAITATKRSAALVGIPTLVESGVAGYAAESWYGLYAPSGTPREVIDRINAAVKKSVNTELFRKKVESEGLVVSAGSPEELDRYVKNEEAHWRRVVQENKITAE